MKSYKGALNMVNCQKQIGQITDPMWNSKARKTLQRMTMQEQKNLFPIQILDPAAKLHDRLYQTV